MGPVRRTVGGLALGALMGGCNLLLPTAAPAPVIARPTVVATVPVAPRPQPSQQSQDIARYYNQLQADLLVQGLLRTDGGGPDTPFTSDMLARNFEQLVLTDEYREGAGLTLASGELGVVRKWVRPVRVAAEFAPSTLPAQRERDLAELTRYVARLSRITGHPIASSVPEGANFHVLFVGQDDRGYARNRLLQLVPDVDRATLALIDQPPRSVQCLVVAFSERAGQATYHQAVAIIRNELPDLLRRSCIHEEVAQGLGLANDSPFARPSIFNDDDEFALLTSHDELLLKMLYDPRVPAGLGAEASRPIVRQLAEELLGGPS